MMKLQPFPELNSERLHLRKLKLSDCDEIFEIRTNQIINQYIFRPKNRQIVDKDGAVNFIQSINEKVDKNQVVFWSINLKKIEKTIGTICLWNFSSDNSTAEVGYDLSLEYHQKGIMHEALCCVIEFGFNELSLRKITAYTHRENKSSCELLKRNNFVLNENERDNSNPNNLIFELNKT